ncbi:catabolite repression protein crec [Pseudohyphozyma bogoriensis]|nr:catabolite repression protein crec [Pseudohyphozyma bogoriensis]
MTAHADRLHPPPTPTPAPISVPTAATEELEPPSRGRSSCRSSSSHRSPSPSTLRSPPPAPAVIDRPPSRSPTPSLTHSTSSDDDLVEPEETTDEDARFVDLRSIRLLAAKPGLPHSSSTSSVATIRARHAAYGGSGGSMVINSDELRLAAIGGAKIRRDGEGYWDRNDLREVLWRSGG